MILFNKPNSSVSDVLKSHQGEPIHYECEICFMYMEGRFGAVGVGMDLTKRETQSKLKKQGLPWTRAKAFDHSALFSPFVAIGNVSPHLNFSLHINDTLTQFGNIPLMIYKP